MILINREGSLAFLENTCLDTADSTHIERYGDTDWLVNDSSLDEYAEDAGMGSTLLSVIQASTQRNTYNAGMEIAAGSNGIALQGLLDLGVLDRALMTNFEDTRNSATSVLERLGQVTGDITARATWNAILDWQDHYAPDGLSVILHRPARALQNLPPATYRGATHLLLDMLRPSGVLFTQIPSSLSQTEAGKDALTDICASLGERDDIDRIAVTGLNNPYVGPFTNFGHALIVKAS